jgi:hypothetical protein
MMPINAETLVAANQNSISPYFRTLKKLNVNGTAQPMVIQIAGLACDAGNQKDIMLAIATSFAGNPTRYL